MYLDVLLCIGGQRTKSADGRSIPMLNPAIEEVVSFVAHAGRGSQTVKSPLRIRPRGGAGGGARCDLR